jgi:hypothetical protein
VLNLWKLFVECRFSAVIIVYHVVKFTSGCITSKREELLYAMRRDQEGRQRQLRTIFKPLEERYGETGESQWTILRRLPCVWPDERSSKSRKKKMMKSLARCKIS